MTIRAPSFFTRSRPSSPVPNRTDFPVSNDFEASNNTLPTRRPLSRLQNPFKRSSSASPAPTNRAPFASGFTPADTASPLPGVGAQYLDTIGLKFAEAASKALANPIGPVVVGANVASAPAAATTDPCAQILKGRKPFPPGRGATLGTLITTELSRSGDVHLSRAIIRTLQRPLSVLLNNLSAMLMPILPYVSPISSQIAASGSVSLIAQAHAIGIARLAAELLEALNSLNGGVVLGAGGVDNLRGIRDGLEVLVKRVVSPLVSSVKLELGPILDKLAIAPSPDVESQSQSVLLSLATILPGITTRLEWYTSPPGGVSQSAHAALLIGLVWRALLALSSRPLTDPFAFPAVATIKKPGSREGMKDGVAKEKTTPPGMKSKKELPFVTALTQISSRSFSQSNPTNSTATLNNSMIPPSATAGTSAGFMETPPRTPPATPRFGRLPLPLPTISRPPSPNSFGGPAVRTKGALAPVPPSPLHRLLADTTTVQAMLSALGKPPQGGLALEAVDEAFDALDGFKGLLRWLVEESGLDGTPQSLQQTVGSLIEQSEDVPALIALNVLVQLISPTQLPRPVSSPNEEPSHLFSSIESNEWRPITVSELIAIPDAEYRASCLAGFGRADAAVEPVGRAILDALLIRRPASPPRTNSSSSTASFLTAVSGSTPLPSFLSADKGLDSRVVRAWLVERIITNDDDKEAMPAMMVGAENGSYAAVELGSDLYATGSSSSSGSVNERRYA